MKQLPRAQHAPELLDEENHDPRELAQSLAQVASVNRWLGGSSALLHHLAPLLNVDRPTRILDVGTGSADLPRRVVEHARRTGRTVEITATDIHPQMRAIASTACAGYPEIRIEAADALSLHYQPESFDVCTLSLTLHHFDGDDQVRALRALGRVARKAVIVNELERTHLNFIGAKLMAATFWRGNRLTRHDGPLSVLRAFTPGELMRIGAAAGMRGRVRRHYFERVVWVGRQR